MISSLHSINWPNFIVWLPFFLEILSNMCIPVVSLKLTVSFLSSCIFLIKSYMIKKPRQKLKNLENKKSFWSENDYEKCILFHLKSSFRSQDIQISVFPTSPQFFPLSHWLRGWFKINFKVYDVSICLNKNLITHLFDISRRKKHMTLKLCQLIEYYVRNIFMEKACRKYGLKASTRSLPNFGKSPATAIACKKLFWK